MLAAFAYVVLSLDNITSYPYVGHDHAKKNGQHSPQQPRKEHIARATGR